MFPVRQRFERDHPTKIRWNEMRCVHCGRLLQKIEEDALRPGKRIEIKCPHCKVINYSVGRPAGATAGS